MLFSCISFCVLWSSSISPQSKRGCSIDSPWWLYWGSPGRAWTGCPSKSLIWAPVCLWDSLLSWPCGDEQMALVSLGAAGRVWFGITYILCLSEPFQGSADELLPHNITSASCDGSSLGSIQFYASLCIMCCLTPNMKDQESKQFLSQVFITRAWHTIHYAKNRNQQEKKRCSNQTSYFFFLLNATIIPMFSLILKQYSTACHKHYYVFILLSNWNPFIKIQHSVMDFFILGLTLSLKLSLVITLHKARSHTQLRQRS